MNRTEAERILQRKFGLNHFYDEQWTVISTLLNGNNRVLMVEKTGFGKSLCYQFPAVIFPGVTVVFSPLIALMRDQVNGLKKKGIAAASINSNQTLEENDAALNLAANNHIKILYITPERQDNQKWIETVIDGKIRISMIVIDEAHTISVWGHDFRPAFRKIVRLVNQVGTNTPILATTATATLKVQKDIAEQIGSNVKVLRGNLVRENFMLYAVEIHSEEEKMIWIKENINLLPGTGIIYAGTKAQAETYSRWIDFLGVKNAFYHSGLDSASRMEIEAGLMSNRWKCVVSTNALGMGIDKPDIRFVIHLQMPASPVHYYQEIGRAGRDGKPTYAVLLYNSSLDKDCEEADTALPKAFIKGAKPNREKYQKTLDYIRDASESPGEKEILLKCNLRQNEFRSIKDDLIEQGIIREVRYPSEKRKLFEVVPGNKQIDFKNFEELRECKIKDLRSMVAYVHTNTPRMEYLCRFLGDQNSVFPQNCDNTTLRRYSINITEEDKEQIKKFREKHFVESELSISRKYKVKVVAASYYGMSSVGSTIHRCKYEKGGDFPDWLVKLVLKAYYNCYSCQKFDCILFVPPSVSGDLVKNFATQLSNALKLPVADILVKTRETQEQKFFRNHYGKTENVKGAFKVTSSIKGKRILLIDDIQDSGNTIREIAGTLLNNGAEEVSALVIAKTVGDDI